MGAAARVASVIRPRISIAIVMAWCLISSLSAQDKAPIPEDKSTGIAVPAPPSAASAPKDVSSAELPVLPDDPTVFLGKTIAEVFADRGPPVSIAPIRGPEAWQDDVEFSWGDGCRFDWYSNHVWRIEFDAAYKGSVFGLFIGDASDKALSLLGQPHFVAEDGLVWRLPWRGYPVQLRIAVKNSVITDIAVFRADL